MLCHSTEVNGMALLDCISACGLLASNSVTDIKSNSYRLLKTSLVALSNCLFGNTSENIYTVLHSYITYAADPSSRAV
jgi:hypothetical protein